MLPDSILGLPTELLESIRARGFTSLTQVQSAVAASPSLERDLRISSQTGSGKTVAVGIAIGRTVLSEGPRRDPATRRAPTVLLLTPTRELAAQVQAELGWLLKKVDDSSVDVVTGGTSLVMERKRLAQGPRVIVGTPGRMLDHLNAGALDGGQVQTVVLDEADQMLDMGFRDELEAILQKLPARGRTHLVSATFSGDVERIAKTYQAAPLRVEGSPLGQANQDIEHVAHVVEMRHRFDALLNILLLNQAAPPEGGEGRCLVFTRTRADTLEIAERLQQLGISAEPMSGDLAQAQRTRTLKGFKNGQISTIVATDVAARGLDIEGVGLVVHLDPPTDSDTMTHRSGRTGRAGRKGRSVLLLPPQARRRIERLLDAAKIKAAFEPVPSPEKVLKAYHKLFRRKIYESIEQVEAGLASGDPKLTELHAFAQKLHTEKAPELVSAAVLSLLEVGPKTAPREILHAFEHHPARDRGKPGGDRFRGGFPRHGRPEAPPEGGSRRGPPFGDHHADPRPRPARPTPFRFQNAPHAGPPGDRGFAERPLGNRSPDRPYEARPYEGRPYEVRRAQPADDRRGPRFTPRKEGKKKR